MLVLCVPCLLSCSPFSSGSFHHGPICSECVAKLKRLTRTFMSCQWHAGFGWPYISFRLSLCWVLTIVFVSKTAGACSSSTGRVWSLDQQGKDRGGWRFQEFLAPSHESWGMPVRHDCCLSVHSWWMEFFRRRAWEILACGRCAQEMWSSWSDVDSSDVIDRTWARRNLVYCLWFQMARPKRCHRSRVLWVTDKLLNMKILLFLR